jgi:hypothetical protein
MLKYEREEERGEKWAFRTVPMHILRWCVE